MKKQIMMMLVLFGGQALAEIELPCDLEVAPEQTEQIHPALFSSFQSPCQRHADDAVKLESHCVNKAGGTYQRALEAQGDFKHKDYMSCGRIYFMEEPETWRECGHEFGMPGGGSWGGGANYSESSWGEAGGRYYIDLFHHKILTWKQIEEEKCMSVKRCFAKTNSVKEVLLAVQLRDALTCRPYLEKEENRKKIDPVPFNYPKSRDRFHEPAVRYSIRYL
ncbi:MAG: hypothetical protein WCG27_11585 [Pseudomonadota bacterium]